MKLNRLILTGICTASAVLLQSCQCCSKKENGEKLVVNKPYNFYVDGKLDQVTVKQAYYDLMNKFNYPIPARLKTDEFWVCDFVQKDVARLGMGGIFWVNAKGNYGETGNKDYQGSFKGQAYGYLGHEIFLLSNQALPEHNHIGGNEGFGPKMEAWQIRYGSARFFGEKSNNVGEKLISSLPENERPYGFGEPWFKSKYYIDKQAGEMWQLNDAESWHFMQAGPEGCIVTEYATYHNHVQFSKPGLVFDNTK